MPEMEGISDIRICGIDPMRPPRVRKEPYIDLYFQLTHQAPVRWCEDFNQLMLKSKIKARIDPSAGLIIETWVQNMNQIEAALSALKRAIHACNDQFIARFHAEAAAALKAGATLNDEGEQGRLNRIIKNLHYED